MSRDAGRSIGALSGLAIGVLIMWSLGYGGVIPLFLFGVGGTVAGGMIGERLVGGQTGSKPLRHQRTDAESKAEERQ